ncbi:hypothetical protein [Haloferax sp. KTX1]|uniref:hypothetical protein n=1 Tax=Haloferax sp. KTX1 TaxID=2600597 RepID=UPI0011DD4412|nr:hypothetical protein [Haloferax sp. KTX1]
MARDIDTGDKVRFHFDGSFSTHQFQPTSPFETEVTLSLPLPDSETEYPTTRIDVQPPAGDQEADTYFFEVITPATEDPFVTPIRAEKKEDGYKSEWGINGIERLENLPQP